jgi:hypothetical protein
VGWFEWFERSNALLRVVTSLESSQDSNHVTPNSPADAETARSPYLDLKVLTPHKTRFNFDAFPYRLDFRDTPAVKKAEDDVVLSLGRLETVFGKIV